MGAANEDDIPVLTDVVANRDELEEQIRQAAAEEVETVIAELQTRLASSAFELTDALMRSAFAEMEAKIYKQISSSLRRELPELIDSIIREQLAKEQEH